MFKKILGLFYIATILPMILLLCQIFIMAPMHYKIVKDMNLYLQPIVIGYIISIFIIIIFYLADKAIKLLS